MDITIAEDEVYNFCLEYFEEEALIAELCLAFMDNYELFVPKENYTVMPKFLDTIIKKFRVLDSNFISPTLEKMNKDMQILDNTLNNLKNKTVSIREVFNKDFLEYSAVLSSSTEFTNYKELKKVYFCIFSAIFYKDKKYYLSIIKEILNSRAFYCDRLLWREAKASNFIKKHFQVNKISEVLNSKNYLLHATSLMRPYTAEYDYYQSCIRIYK